MSFDRPSTGVFVMQCDACFDTLELTADEGHPTEDVPACLKLAREAGWKAKKVVGYAWEHYCPACAELPDDEQVPRPKPQ